jgi:hypothetical protein
MSQKSPGGFCGNANITFFGSHNNIYRKVNKHTRQWKLIKDTKLVMSMAWSGGAEAPLLLRRHCELSTKVMAAGTSVMMTIQMMIMAPRFRTARCQQSLAKKQDTVLPT